MVSPQPSRFHDGGPVGGPPDRERPLRIVLERGEGEVGRFAMGRAIGYDDRVLGELLVPADASFRTDLASVPWLFTWLVPRVGAHLPAALLHDGLVGGVHGAGSSYVSTEGHRVARDEADRVFRDAMADTGTGVVRRWLVWSAVTVATIAVGSAAWTRRQRVGYLLAALATVLTVLVLGTLATLDLFDAGATLPWMGDRPWWRELLGGAAGAVTIPFLLALLWGRFRVAGAILGILLALLLHVSTALLLLTGIYQGIEWFARAAPAAAYATAGVVVAVAFVLFGLYLWA